jgi:two-component system OmpR family response regulator
MSLPLPSAPPAPTPHILVVDDDRELREQIVSYLAEHGFEVTAAADATGMDAALAANSVDLLILDVMLPGEGGLSICQRLARSAGPPIIMVSAMGEEIDRVLGLELGADDYVPKPCSPRELLARVRAVLRRREERDTRPTEREAGANVYRFLGYTLDVVRRQLKNPGGAAILLTAGEFSLLSAFLENPGRILSRDQLIEMARGGEPDVFDRAIDVQISRLRRKLKADDGHDVIRTYRGAGYLFDAKVQRP